MRRIEIVVANEYLKYTSKDYHSIYTDLVASIPTITDLWTNTEDGDPGIVLVKLMSALGDMLSYNMDKQALEYYSSTVTQRKNAAKLFNLIGYKMHWYRSATNRIAVTNTQIVPNKYLAVPIYKEYLVYAEIPPEERTPEQEAKMQELKQEYIQYSQWFIDSHPIEDYPEYYGPGGQVNYEYLLGNSDSLLYQEYTTWETQNTLNLYTYIAATTKTIDVKSANRTGAPYIIKPTTASNEDSSGDYLNPTDTIKPGQTHYFDVIQGTLNSIRFNSAKLRNNRYYFSESAIDETNIWLSYDSTQNADRPTTQVFIDKTDNLLTVTDDNIYFEFGIDDFDIPYIELSSYWTSKLGDSVDFTLYYVRSEGVYGNITKNFLTTIEGLSKNSYTITHPSNNTPYIDDKGRLIATPGYHPQTAQQAYIDSLNYVTTFNTLVTIYDFERFCKRQEGISNTYAVDIQRAKDLNDALYEECYSLTLAQLQAYYDDAKNKAGVDRNDLTSLREFYIQRKTVHYNEYNTTEGYKAYGLNLHVICGNFDLSMTYLNGVMDESDIIAYMNNYNNRFWLYQIATNYQVEYLTTPDGNYVRDAEGKLVIKHSDYNSIEDVAPGDGRIAHYLDEKFRETKIVNVCPEYAAARVFPWRCCGTIYLKNPVTETVANQILSTVMEHLRAALHPANIEFGKKINYMDVITVVTESHEMIRYFDAGLASRKLIDIDDSVDITYFNNTSLMYYVQSEKGFAVGDYYMEGNNTSYKHGSTTETNPYYGILSIATECIVK